MISRAAFAWSTRVTLDEGDMEVWEEKSVEVELAQEKQAETLTGPISVAGGQERRPRSSARGGPGSKTGVASENGGRRQNTASQQREQRKPPGWQQAL